jgi:YfiH family protein
LRWNPAVINEIRRSPLGPYLDLSPLFPEGVFALVTLNGFSGVAPETLSELLDELGLGRVVVHRVEQVHSDRVVSSRESPCQADAVLSEEHGEAVRVVAADCVPILMARRDGSAVAAVHAGWKGTLARIVSGAVRRLSRDGGRDLIAYLGPAIGPCCYTVGAERAVLFREAFPGWLAREEESDRLDLPAINVRLLEETGVPSGSIHVEERCTACSVGLCCSYRRDGTSAGRMAALIGRRRWAGD